MTENAEKAETETLCNLCGLSCMFVQGRKEQPWPIAHGLVDQVVSGGYESTAGNGHGALDDGFSYRFSLCEFCLDWLFSQFQIPVCLEDYINGASESWRPAAQRVATDDWRRMKKEFQEEYDRRDVARKAGRP